MKNKFLSLTFILVLVFSASFAQLTFEHSYTGAAEVADCENFGYKYFVTDYLMNSVQVYNEDHSPWKNISIPVPPNTFLYDVAYVSSKVFNPDDLVEVLAVCYEYVTTSDTSGYYIYTTLVFNENGNVLLTVPGGSYSFTFTDNYDHNKLVVYIYDYSLSVYITATLVYALPDKVAGIKNGETQNLLPYPNPAAQEINIPIGNQLQQTSHFIVISDLNGKEYLKVPVEQGQSLSNISTSSLPSGSYIYRVEGNGISRPAGKFVKR